MSTGSSSHHSPSVPNGMPPPTPARHQQHPSSSPPSRCRRSPSPHTIQQLLDTLRHQRVNTITELCRIERAAAACTRPDDARAFQAPMTQAWVRYVTGHQLLGELRGLTRGYPFSAELVREAYAQVRADPRSNRSWNLAWLCLVRIRGDDDDGNGGDDGLIATYAVAEASKPSMWGGLVPREEDVLKLSGCFSREWTLAVSVMLKHWPVAPTWC